MSDQSHKKIQDAKKKASQLLTRLNKPNLELSEHENVIAVELVLPEEIDVTFEDVGGLDDAIEILKESVIYPFKHHHLYSTNSLVGLPKGVVLHGPPGCGKSMLAKAVAKEADLTFINVKYSTLTDKYYGESNKLTNALFSLAVKLQPTLIFIDEIDAFLRTRNSSDHEVTNMLKAEFMSLWDGIASSTENKVVVMGATNRINDIDSAFLRRLTKKIEIKKPQVSQRTKILKKIITQNKERFSLSDADFSKIAKVTQDLTGCDLKDICADAAMIPIRECIKLNKNEDELRKVTLNDFMSVIKSNYLSETVTHILDRNSDNEQDVLD